MKKVPRSRLESALREAIHHVVRQETAGKHEQDRADAEEFLQKYRDVVLSLRTWTR